MKPTLSVRVLLAAAVLLVVGVTGPVARAGMPGRSQAQPSPDWFAEGGQANAMYALTSSTAGDVNADGYEDVIVGATRYDGGQANEGAAFLYLGSASGLSPAPTWTAEGNQADAQFASSVATAGDVNGDGYADVIVGALGYQNGQREEGAAYVYLGSSSGMGAEPAWMAEGDQAKARFGRAVGPAGDVNRDGYDDVIVGAPMYDAGQTDEGMVSVYLGSPAGLGASPAWTAQGDQAYAFLGVSVQTAGDVNGDGFADVVVGASRYDDGESNEGAAFVYQGSPSGLGPAPAWIASPNQAMAMFGVSVGTAGDVNGDGYDDVIVGAQRYSNPEKSEGAAFVYLGGPTGLAPDPAWQAEGNQAEARMGESLEAAVDVNGDGFADVVVAAPHYNDGRVDVGQIYVYHGSRGGLQAEPAWVVLGDQAEARFGCSVSAADANGDGFTDVFVGAPRYDHGQINEGTGYLYEGSVTR